MAELAASVGHHLIHVDYDNNKQSYNSDELRRGIHAQDPGSAGSAGPGPGFLVDFQSIECPPPPPPEIRLSETAVHHPGARQNSFAVFIFLIQHTPQSTCS